MILPRLPLEGAARDRAVALRLGYFDDRSRIVVVEAMTALATVAAHDPVLRPRVVAEIELRLDGGGHAIRSRARKLLTAL